MYLFWCLLLTTSRAIYHASMYGCLIERNYHYKVHILYILFILLYSPLLSPCLPHLTISHGQFERGKTLTKVRQRYHVIESMTMYVVEVQATTM